MHHLYPLAKGDQLCPLGFHPQVRWPTRCKRCFRDYKEHGGKRGSDDIAASSPSLSDSFNANKTTGRTWTSTQNLSTFSENNSNNDVELRKRPSSWTSTPDLEELEKVTQNNVDVSVNLKLPPPRRRFTTTLDSKELEESLLVKRPPLPPTPSSSASSSTQASKTTAENQNSDNGDIVILKTDSLAERVRKMNLLKKQNSTERESSRERSREKSIPRKIDKEKSPSTDLIDQSRKQIIDPPNEAPAKKEVLPKSTATTSASTSKKETKSAIALKKTTIKKQNDAIKATQDVQFLIQIKENSTQQKNHHDNDNMSVTTETTDTTLVDPNENSLQEEVKNLKKELELMKTRAERAERDKSDILLRRLASLDTGPNRTAASEALKLQQKVNELNSQVEELRDDKRSLSLKVKELEQDLKSRPAKTIESELRRKLQAAEQLCEELMDENEDMKKELRGMEQEIDEMHDTFREDQAEEYTTLRKELEQTTKNCRILSFKLKKSERRIEQLENEKQTSPSTKATSEMAAKIKKLEDDLKLANELSRRLQNEVDQAKNPGQKKKPPSLGVIGKSTSADGKYTRESLTRGGSQEDPAQLMRDLQDSMEREADLREQLKFAEEEAESLRKKASRIEDENESLMMQLKKMASRARTRKLSPTSNRLHPEPIVERDEGISDEDDPAELRILLELNEQEASILRQKVEDLETENTENKKQIKELQDKLKSSTDTSKRLPSFLSRSSSNTQSDKKLKILEDETAELRKSIIDKDRTIDRLKAEIAASVAKKDKNSTTNNQNSFDTKRQLEIIEQEASVLRGKLMKLEQENEKLSAENKKLQLQSLRKSSLTTDKNNGTELVKLKETLSKVEKERDELDNKLKSILNEANDKLPTRTAKKVTDLTPKTTLKKWVEELEDEIKNYRAMIVQCGADRLQKLENEKNSIGKEVKVLKDQLETANSEIKKLKTSKEGTSSQSLKISELEQKYKKSEEERKTLSTKIKDLEENIKKQDQQIKTAETTKMSLDIQLKRERDKIKSLEKDLEKERQERNTWERKVADLDDELISLRKSTEITKTTLEKEIQDLRLKSNKSDSTTSTKKLQELKKQNDDLQANLTKEIKHFSELTGRYETLSEEYVHVKAELATIKKNLQSEQNNIKQKQADYDELKNYYDELIVKLKETQKRVNDLESKNIKANAVQYEKNMLKSTLSEKEHELEKLKQQNEMNVDLISQIKKENDELRRQLDDFGRLDKAKRSINDRNSNLEDEIRKLQAKLNHTELSAKSEVAATRLRYEQQVKNLNTELTSMQRQCERFKKDRDTFKQLLESAQKAIADLKSSGRQSRSSGTSGDEDDKGKIIQLEQQIGCLEDQLSESRLELSKLKTELVSERSANEIKISEMTSKLNEYEEDRLLGSGRTKVAGVRTKLELSWQKEREEQQRLLQETSTLARDLRQTLFEVERERDKERIESRRKLDQLKKANEEELEEGRKKISELQCDLLELRDAHAKLRTTNEKLRRDRERHEKEIMRRRIEQDGEQKIGILLQTVDELVKIAPELNMGQNLDVAKRNRSPSPAPTNVKVSSVLARLAEASEDLRKYQRLCEDEKERDRSRRSGIRRATSTENENLVGVSSSGGRVMKISRSSGHNGSLYRKSLSLDQSIQQDQFIWQQNDGSVSSIQSIDSELGGNYGRDSSMDSRLSGGSTQSDIIPRPRKKKRGLMGKLRSLTKSRTAESEGSVQGSDSDISVASDAKSNKKDLRERISGMFKRSSSTSRSNSTEHMLNDSLQRPVAVTIYGDDLQPRTSSSLPPPTAGQPVPQLKRTPTMKPPTPTTPITQRKVAK